MGLHDAVLVKDNHIAHVPADELPAVLSRAIAEARRSSPPPAFVEIEVDTHDQLRAVLGLDVDVVLLDNMNPSQLAEAVRLRDQIGPSVQLEASGGVDLGTVRAIAEAGVDRIAVGALTHSAPALDIALEVTERSG
jgi:nicotinate-nucleotide pyrophosphorylase (carboxylating)